VADRFMPKRCWAKQESQIGPGTIKSKREPLTAPVSRIISATLSTLWLAVATRIAGWVPTAEDVGYQVYDIIDINSA